MPDEAVERVGSLVDERYQVVEVLAAGSMGAVYKAERVPVGKIVAIKFLHSTYANDAEFQTRFEREIRVLSKLGHPNCVSVVDFGAWQGAPYIVMDYVGGKTLRQRIDEGALPPIHALAIARQIAAGLAHAHAQGIYHRDVKPANIMITDEIGHGERVRILDFGLARLRGNVGRDATQTNMVVGTPNYMAPEQTVAGAKVDARCDIYALGVVLFEMIVGERPFQAEDTMQLLGMHRAAPIPKLADRVKPGVDLLDGLQAVIDKAMAKSPGDRYQSAIELANAIDEVTGGRAVPEEDVTVPRSQPVHIKSLLTSEAMAPTVPHIDSSASIHNPPPRRLGRALVAAALVVGGAGAMAAYLIHRGAEQTETSPKIADAGTLGSGSGAGSAIAMIWSDAAVALGAPLDAEAEPDAGAAAAVSDGGAATGSGDEIEIDPTAAVDPDPQAGSATGSDDEAADAPKTPEELEKHEPAPPPEAPHLARTLPAAVQLLKAGKREEARASLRALWKKAPASAYIPFLLGNIYYDMTWWSVSMDHYAIAIKKNAGYRNNGVLIRNVIRMLASGKTRQKATNFLRGTIGHPAAAYLKVAAAKDPNPVVRKQAKDLAHFLH